MTESVKKVLFIEASDQPAAPVSGKGENYAEWISVEQGVQKGVGGRSLYYESFKRPQVDVLFAKSGDQFISIEEYESQVHEENSPNSASRFLTFADLEGRFRERLHNFIVELGSSLACRMMGEGDFDAIVVNSQSIIDILAIGVTNYFLKDYSGTSIPIILRVGDVLVGRLEREVEMKRFETFTGFGNPSMPTNLKLPKAALERLEASKDASYLDDEAWRFVRGLSKLSAVGRIPMFAGALPFMGAVLYDSADLVGRLGNVDRLNLPEDIVSSVLGEESLSEEHALVRAIYELLDHVQQKGYWVFEKNEMAGLLENVRFMKLNPAAVRQEVLRLSTNGKRNAAGERIANAVYNNLSGLNVVRRISKTSLALATRRAPERAR